MSLNRRRRDVLSLIAAPFASRGAERPSGKSDGVKTIGKVLRVGPTHSFRTLREAAATARAGETIEVAADKYMGDVAIIDKDFLRVVGIGGRPQFIAAGADVEGKGMLVVRARGVEIENVEFSGARAADHLGSGVRVEKGSLLLRNCRFADNEFGVMTANDPSIVLEVAGCEFSGLLDDRGRGGVLSHSLYVGAIDFVRVEGSFFHDGSRGHLIKSRARSSVIRYNRLADRDGIASYELEFPDGGLAEVVGNVILQGRRSENSAIISYGEESLRWKDNQLEVLFNTLVNEMPVGGYFVSVRPSGVAATVRHNVLVGSGTLRLGSGAHARSNIHAKFSDFANPADVDFRPRVGTPWVGAASGIEHDFPRQLLPNAEYSHPASVRALQRSRLGSLNPGAFQTLAN